MGGPAGSPRPGDKLPLEEETGVHVKGRRPRPPGTPQPVRVAHQGHLRHWRSLTEPRETRGPWVLGEGPAETGGNGGDLRARVRS